MIKVVILGTGNVAKHLFDAFSKTDSVRVVQVIGRNDQALNYFGPSTANLQDPQRFKDADMYIIAVSDNSIEIVSQLLVHKKSLIAHTSGSVALQALYPNKNRGVFYPLQTFSKEKEVDFERVPICIESDNERGLNLLEQLAKAVSKKVYHIGSEERKQLHLAAVFANNFTNHLYHIAHDICEEHGVPFDILKPLIIETAAKIQEQSPKSMQTGPARRHDTKTIEKHLTLLASKKHKEIYALLSESIRTDYGKKL